MESVNQKIENTGATDYWGVLQELQGKGVGDVNEDGSVNIKDACLIFYYNTCKDVNKVNQEIDKAIAKNVAAQALAGDETVQ